MPFLPGGPSPGRALKSGVEEVTASIGQSVVAVEPTGCGEGYLVPLSGNESAVPNGSENFSEGGPVLHFVVPNGIGVVAGEEFGPGGMALGGVVELGEAQTVLGELVEVGRLDFTSIAADVRVAHVIHQGEVMYLGAGVEQ